MDGSSGLEDFAFRCLFVPIAVAIGPTDSLSSEAMGASPICGGVIQPEPAWERPFQSNPRCCRQRDFHAICGHDTARRADGDDLS
jgi:hypothetical protein